MARPDPWRDTPTAQTLVDRRGDIWLADGRSGLHHYSETTQQWETLTAADLGFSPPPPATTLYDYHPTAITDVVQDPFGNIWVSSCHIRRYAAGHEPEDNSRLYQEGGGIRIFNGRTWDSDTQLPNRCLLDLAAPSDGRIWAAIASPEQGDSGLRAYDFSENRWLDYSPWAQTGIFQGEALVADRFLVQENALILILQRRWYGDIWPSTVQIYETDNGRWQTLLDGLDSPPTLLAIDPNNYVWSQTTGFLVHGQRTDTDILMELGDWEILKLAVDGQNRLWLYGRPTADQPYDIWHYHPDD